MQTGIDIPERQIILRKQTGTAEGIVKSEYRMTVGRLTETLKQELASGQYPRGTKFPSEYELAERFGINKTTANRAVTQLVNLGLLERGIRGSGTRVLREEIFPAGQIAFFTALPATHASMVVSGAVERLLHSRYLLTLFTPEPCHLPEYLNDFHSMPFQGILTMSYGALTAPEGIPLIHVDQEFSPADPVHHAVNGNSFEGAYRLMNAVYEAGHRKIALFLTDIAQLHLSSPKRGFIRSMREHGCTDALERCFYGKNGDPESAKEVLQDILRKYPDVTLIATENDNDAAAMIQEIALFDSALLRRIQVTGFSGLPHLCKRFALPSMDLRLRELGYIAADQLLHMIRHGIPEKPLRCVVEPRPVNLDKIRRIPPAAD